MAAADVMPDFNSTILLFAIVNACCLVLVAIMSLLVIKGTLLSNKQYPPDEDVKYISKFGVLFFFFSFSMEYPDGAFFSPVDDLVLVVVEHRRGGSRF